MIPDNSLSQLETIIIDVAGDGDCCCRQAIIECVKVIDDTYSDDTINDVINDLLSRGLLLSDGYDSIIDPVARPNTAARIRAGKKCI